MARERWWSRVVPVTALAVGLVAVLAVLVPGVRHQVALSASHEPQQYVELAFARGEDGTVVTCRRVLGQVRVSFDVTSHYEEPREVAYHVTAAGHRRPGSVTVDPGRTVRVTRVVEPPGHARGYQVRVDLPGEDRHVRARCGASS